MKQKIKLRDLTEEQYETWRKENCMVANCNTCPFLRARCILGEFCWVKNKDIYSDKFLDQEIKIEIELLTPKEKEYLEGVIKPFKDKVITISKRSFDINFEYISILIKDDVRITLPNFVKNNYYKNMEVCREYTLKDLRLIQSKYKFCNFDLED
ncbi:MAG: hypothetical protein PUI63_06835 [Alistipes senegalensis]|uniref:hypothetical protein n=1 Tax=Alistipes senegalensis TaxID=1288121 RepID=UPI002430692D|nr:hypothetical protein [Alistipes senegalensis]MDD7038941.1 hypothetical protein [Alistipes senegalensis]